MTPCFGLSGSTIDKICSVFARHPEIEQAILYGSRVKGNFKSGSDIDLTLRGGPDLTQVVLYVTIQELDDLMLPYTIDISLFQTLNDHDLMEHIQRVGVVVYERKSERSV
ncbi:MAG TPA: nucleotidyltransferase domain-containing protein [Desulfuromonadales bacterium]|nr:nucleotidyltransferase domain-containing protein [Desulfuromonadales bacterium]